MIPNLWHILAISIIKRPIIISFCPTCVVRMLLTASSIKLWSLPRSLQLRSYTIRSDQHLDHPHLHASFLECVDWPFRPQLSGWRSGETEFSLGRPSRCPIEPRSCQHPCYGLSLVVWQELWNGPIQWLPWQGHHHCQILDGPGIKNKNK